MNEVVTIDKSQWELMQSQAKMLLDSGMLPASVRTVPQVITITLKAKELNVPQLEGLSSINVIQGKPTISPQLMLALARRTKELEDMKVEYEEDDTCVITVKRKGQSPITTRFGNKEAKEMKLAGKDNYLKQPKTMYQWRALSANLRLSFADVVCGCYTHEELLPDGRFDDQGNVLDKRVGPDIAPPDPEIKVVEEKVLEVVPEPVEISELVASLLLSIQDASNRDELAVMTKAIKDNKADLKDVEIKLLREAWSVKDKELGK